MKCVLSIKDSDDVDPDISATSPEVARWMIADNLVVVASITLSAAPIHLSHFQLICYV